MNKSPGRDKETTAYKAHNKAFPIMKQNLQPKKTKIPIHAVTLIKI